MAKYNNLNSLNEVLFSVLDDLDNPDLSGEELKNTIERSKGIANVSKCITNNAKLMLDAQKLAIEHSSFRNTGVAEMLALTNTQKRNN